MPEPVYFPDGIRTNAGVVCSSLTIPPGTLVNAGVNASAGIEASKLVHRKSVSYTQVDGTAIVAANSLLHIFRAAGIMRSFEAIIATAGGGDRTVSVDLQYGNASTGFTSALVAPISITSGTAVRTPITATLAAYTPADGDILRVVVTVGGTTGAYPQGLLTTAVFDENPV